MSDQFINRSANKYFLIFHLHICTSATLRFSHLHICIFAYLHIFLLCGATSAFCQDLEPRRYMAIPIKANAIAAQYGFMKGNVISDPSLPVSDFTITTHNFAAGYLRSFKMLNKLTRVVVTIPFTHMSGDLRINGRDTSGTRSGFNDAQVRIGMNLTGCPALDLKHFVAYSQKTIFGVSIVVNFPTGTYRPEKYINTGTHRWGFKPEIGVSKRFKRFYAEAYTGVWFYTLNKKYLGEKTLRQDPILGLQGHVCYYFKNGMWVAVNGTRFNGGKTFVDDVNAGDIFDNWRVGGTWSVPVAKGHSLKLQFHVGAFATRGYDYNLVSLGYQYIFF